jgi:hypothetical protein
MMLSFSKLKANGNNSTTFQRSRFSPCRDRQPQYLAAFPNGKSAGLWRMSTKSRRSLYGISIQMSAGRAKKARKEADQLAAPRNEHHLGTFAGLSLYEKRVEVTNA